MKNAIPIIVNLNQIGNQGSSQSKLFMLVNGSNIKNMFKPIIIITELIRGMFVYIGFLKGFDIEKFNTEMTY